MTRDLVALTIRLLQNQNVLGQENGTMGSNFRFDCPFSANHGGRKKQDTPSFYIHMDDGRFNCFGCKRGGPDVYNLYASLLGITLDDAKRQVGRPENILHSLQMGLDRLNPEEWEPFCKTDWPYTVPLSQAPSAQEYLDRRGIPRWLQEKAGLCFCPSDYMPPTPDNKGRVPGKRVIFPIHWKGQRIGYSGRSLQANVDMKYYRPVERINQTVYNPMGYTPENTEEIWPVEGEISSLIAIREGCASVCTWGSDLSMEQAAFLCRFKRVRMMYDPDPAGLGGMKKALDAYAQFMHIATPVYLPPKMDPGDMPPGFGKTVIDVVKQAEANREFQPLMDLRSALDKL
jgi:DNA primase